MIRQALARIAAPFIRAPTEPPAEGEPRPGPWPTINPDGWLPNEWGQFVNFWQMGLDPISGSTSAVVEACVAAYAQTIAMCPGDHWWRNPATNGRERVTTSALSRVLRRPNDYQSRSDFVLNLVRDLYLEGNTYHLAQRNDRFEVAAFHPFNPRTSAPRIASTGDVFYQLAGNNILEHGTSYFGGSGSAYGIVPARDVLHIKLEAKSDQPLVGIPPIRHAAAAIAAQTAIGSSLISFFANMSRPSGILSTEQNLTKEQVAELRARWNEQSKGLNAGGTPILTSGLKFQGISVTAKDAEMAAALKLTQEEIFMVYGVPPAILGMTDKSTFASTEALMQFWLSRGLGFAINHVEVALDHFFGLKGYPDEWVEFDTTALLRVAYKDRIEALARGTIGGIFAPDEARATEDLPAVPGGFGEEPRVQQQVVPLSAWASVPPATPAPPSSPPAAGPDVSGGGDPPPPAKDWGEYLTQKVAENDRQAA